jgi:flavoprotein
MANVKTPRLGRALTGSGHFFKECLRMAGGLEDFDLLVSKAASEVVRMYGQDFKLSKTACVFRDTTASAAPVGLSYYGVYHTLFVAPATSNTVAKCVGTDTPVTNVFAQAGKCRVSAIVFALRHRARARHRNAQRHGQGLSAGYRSAEHRAPQVVREHDVVEPLERLEAAL